MGYGDDLLITSYASKIKKKFPKKQIVIGNRSKKQAYHSIIYDNNPNISDCRNLDLSRPIYVIDYHPENRPYINYEKSTNTKYIWNKNFRPSPGEIFFSETEDNNANEIIKKAKEFWGKKNKKSYKNIIFLEATSTKVNHKNFNIKHINKDWGFDNWLNLINRIKNDYLIIQSVHAETKEIDGIFSPKNIDFRLACAILNKCDLYVGLEGGFGHAAAALKKKAVVYFGGWISPELIGYNFHKNIYFKNTKSPCGEYRSICEHCEVARREISVEFFEEKIRNI